MGKAEEGRQKREGQRKKPVGKLKKQLSIWKRNGAVSMGKLRKISKISKILCLVLLVSFAGCQKREAPEGASAALTPKATKEEAATPEPAPTKEPTLTPEPTAAAATPEPTPTNGLTLTPEPTAAAGTPKPTQEPGLALTNEPAPTKEPEEGMAATPEPAPTNGLTLTPEPTAVAATPEPTKEPEPTQAVWGRIIVLDAGHQQKGNSEKEPNGPGSDTMKAKVSSGTRGVSTGLWEYELNLQVALKLKEELTARGYTVIMVRETHDVDISNAERAKLANEAGADAFLRIHANASDNPSAKGVLTICQTAQNPYNSAWYEESRRLSELVLEQVAYCTGAKKRPVWETDTMTGINWAMVPSAILEMGFMTNPEEDELMATEGYQDNIVRGAADAIDLFFAE